MLPESMSLSPKMFYSIDYYSFTIATREPLGKALFDGDLYIAVDLFCGLLPNAELAAVFQTIWTREKSRGFYTARFRHDQSDITLSYGQAHPHIFFELAGKACNNLDARELLLPLIHKTFERATRIDIAVDIPTTTTPEEFVRERTGRNFKSSGSIKSASGATEYLGGRTSERMARVYRFEEPHPRSHLLRVEAEYKGDAAKALCKYLSTQGLLATSLAAHQIFGWKHHSWVAEDLKVSKIPYKHYHPANASTLRWLYGDVINALRRAIAEETINLDEWLAVLKDQPNEYE